MINKDAVAVVELRNKLETFFGNEYSYYIETYGCAQNESDSEIIEGILQALGFAKSEYKTKAQIVLLNSCAVRDSAELKFLGKLGELKPLKIANNDVILAVCGCMFSRKESQELIRKSYPYIDIVGDANFVDQLVDLLAAFMSEKTKQVAFAQPERNVEEVYPVVRNDKLYANIPISYGCNNFCSYCIVPLARGQEVCRKAVDIENEFRAAIESGYKYITLLGQNVNSYHSTENSESINFAALVERLASIKGEFVISYLSSHPKFFTRELIDVIAANKKMSRHIHLPLQSGSNNILRSMERGYTYTDYLELINYANRKIKDVTFSSDIIVGFPGESDHEFNMTIDAIEEIRFLKLFTYIYSKRNGTKAADYADTTLQSVKTQRIEKLISLQRHITIALLNDYKRTKQKILVEKVLKDNTGIGKMDNGIVVRFRFYGPYIDYIGQFVNVEIISSTATDLEGLIS